MLLSPLKIKDAKKQVPYVERIYLLETEFVVLQLRLQKRITKPCISSAFRSNEDWEAWERLSRLKGDFLYDSTIQMGHRIHEESETSVIIGDNARSKEDYEMFCKLAKMYC